MSLFSFQIHTNLQPYKREPKFLVHELIVKLGMGKKIALLYLNRGNKIDGSNRGGVGVAGSGRNMEMRKDICVRARKLDREER